MLKTRKRCYPLLLQFVGNKSAGESGVGLAAQSLDYAMSRQEAVDIANIRVRSPGGKPLQMPMSN